MINEKLKQRFLKYISFDTQSCDESNTIPSTMKQKDLGEYLANELSSLGISEAFMDEHGYVYAYIPSNCGSENTLGLIAHLDTSDEASGKNVNPQIIKNYDGNTITLLNGLQINPKTYSSLKKATGHTLITTDGTTLLGADDKAGIAIIMETVEQLINSKDAKYPNVYICFTPDEEIGSGTDPFNYDYFKVDFAYTIDGAETDTISFENFNAATAIVDITGYNIHPGDAKNKMVNSTLIAMEFNSMLPSNQTPSTTEGYEGFFHLNSINGDVENTKLNYLIRNHNKDKFNSQKELMIKATEYLNKKYGNIVNLQIIDSYFNMSELVMKKPLSLELPVKAMLANKIDAKFLPIRGGTDGARLTYEGIVCPNLGTGSYNHHGVLEYADIDEMNQMVNILITLLHKSLTN